jgi:hypothetical protein
VADNTDVDAPNWIAYRALLLGARAWLIAGHVFEFAVYTSVMFGRAGAMVSLFTHLRCSSSPAVNARVNLLDALVVAQEVGLRLSSVWR